jgi:DNA polymerase-3 subunit alpha
VYSGEHFAAPVDRITARADAGQPSIPNGRARTTVSPDPCFVHLHVHSAYSLLEGALTIARLAELAKADRQPALALTDVDNMFGALEFS